SGRGARGPQASGGQASGESRRIVPPAPGRARAHGRSIPNCTWPEASRPEAGRDQRGMCKTAPMSQPKAGSALVQAVTAFDDELERFARAPASACRRNLESKRELEKAAEAVREAGEAERTMQQRAQELLQALKAAQAEQEERAQ